MTIERRFGCSEAPLSLLSFPPVRPSARPPVRPSAYFPLSTCSSNSHRFIQANF
jgi:hypothetical protein